MKEKGIEGRDMPFRWERSAKRIYVSRPTESVALKAKTVMGGTRDRRVGPTLSAQSPISWRTPLGRHPTLGGNSSSLARSSLVLGSLPCRYFICAYPAVPLFCSALTRLYPYFIFA